MARRPLLKSHPESAPLPRLSQGDHLRMLLELLHPAGPELARRWLAALLLVDRADREALVAEIERRVTAAYPPAPGLDTELHVRSAPVQREGFVEEVETTYAASPRTGSGRAARVRKRGA